MRDAATIPEEDRALGGPNPSASGLAGADCTPLMSMTTTQPAPVRASVKSPAHRAGTTTQAAQPPQPDQPPLWRDQRAEIASYVASFTAAFAADEIAARTVLRTIAEQISTAPRMETVLGIQSAIEIAQAALRRIRGITVTPEGVVSCAAIDGPLASPLPGRPIADSREDARSYPEPFGYPDLGF